MMMSENWDELESLVNKAQKSVKEFSESTRGGASSPIEKRMADSFTDIVTLLNAHGKAMDALSDQQRLLDKRLRELMDATQLVNNNADSIRRTVAHEAGIAINDAMIEYDDTMQNLQTRADLVLETLNKINDETTKDYKNAVDQNVKRLTITTSAAIAVQATFAILGGILASIGAFFVYQIFPPVQQFIENNGLGSLVIIVIGVALLLYLTVCFITRKQ